VSLAFLPRLGFGMLHPFQGEPAMRNATLHVNGRDRSATLDDEGMPLLYVLRGGLGQCGACTVLVDGKRNNSCLTLAVMQNGKSITTVEGLATGEQLDPLQQAFIDNDAFQCGYCTPGQLCSAKGLIAEGQARTVAEVRELMSGNICRCGAYPQIVAAVTSVMGMKDHKDNPERPYLPGTVPA